VVAGIAEDEGLTVIGVSSGVDGFEAIASTAIELHIDGFPHIADLDGSVWARFGVFGQPASVVVTADGAVTGHMGDLDADGFADFVERARLGT
jgi:peroxiredoxin